MYAFSYKRVSLFYLHLGYTRFRHSFEDTFVWLICFLYTVYIRLLTCLLTRLLWLPKHSIRGMKRNYRIVSRRRQASVRRGYRVVSM